MMLGSRQAPSFMSDGSIDAPLVTRRGPELEMGMPNQRPGWSGKEGIYKTGVGGALQRVGDALKEPGMSHALLKGAAAAFNGKGLGGSIDAITGSMDQTHARQDHLAQQEQDNEFQRHMQQFRESQQAATEAYQDGQLALGNRNADNALLIASMGQAGRQAALDQRESQFQRREGRMTAANEAREARLSRPKPAGGGRPVMDGTTATGPGGVRMQFSGGRWRKM